ncbi:MAG: ATP-grasp domain-containing protein [Chloroflexi bacterium]|nr:MAG: ATP-grasp domain-containing protein [Chloroflexota bacterium]
MRVSANAVAPMRGCCMCCASWDGRAPMGSLSGRCPPACCCCSPPAPTAPPPSSPPPRACASRWSSAPTRDPRSATSWRGGSSSWTSTGRRTSPTRPTRSTASVPSTQSSASTRRRCSQPRRWPPGWGCAPAARARWPRPGTSGGRGPRSPPRRCPSPPGRRSTPSPRSPSPRPPGWASRWWSSPSTSPARMLGTDPGCARPGPPPLVVERFAGGPEVAVEGLLDGGRLRVLAVFDKPDPLDGPFFEETLYVTPSRLAPGDLAAVERRCAEAVAALGLTEGPVHAELRLPAPGDPVVIEVAARSIGGRCSTALRFAGGESLEELILRQAAGLSVGEPRLEGASGVLMLPIERGGRLVAVEGLDRARAVPGVESASVSVPVGEPLVPLPEGDRYLGFVLARGESAAGVEAALRRAWAELHVVVTDAASTGVAG